MNKTKLNERGYPFYKINSGMVDDLAKKLTLNEYRIVNHILEIAVDYGGKYQASYSWCDIELNEYEKLTAYIKLYDLGFIQKDSKGETIGINPEYIYQLEFA